MRPSTTPLKFVLLAVTLSTLSACVPNKSREANQADNMTGNGCVPRGDFKCTLKSGLAQGQKFTLSQDLVLPLNASTVFADGKKDNQPSIEGQPYCQVAFATSGPGPNGKTLLSDSLKIGHLSGRVPANLAPYVMVEIAWYVEQVFLAANVGGENLKLSVYCGKLRNGLLEMKEGDMSLEAFQSALHGVFDLVK